MLIFDGSFVRAKINTAARRAIRRTVVAFGLVHPCAFGHLWVTAGGRPCPRRHVDDQGRFSQTVFRCARCPVYDYGEPGGPGYENCYTDGPCHDSCVVDVGTVGDGVGITAPSVTVLEQRRP